MDVKNIKSSCVPSSHIPYPRGDICNLVRLSSVFFVAFFSIFTTNHSFLPYHYNQKFMNLPWKTRDSSATELTRADGRCEQKWHSLTSDTTCSSTLCTSIWQTISHRRHDFKGRFTQLVHATNICHFFILSWHGNGAIVHISTTSPLPTDCRLCDTSEISHRVYLIRELIFFITFPRLVYTWKAGELCLWTVSNFPHV